MTIKLFKDTWLERKAPRGNLNIHVSRILIKKVMSGKQQNASTELKPREINVKDKNGKDR